MRNLKFMKFVGLFVLASMSLNSVAFAGGYCPTWVKVSDKTPVANVYTVGTKFLATVIEITAGTDADATINKVLVNVTGKFNYKDVVEVSLTNAKGVRYGFTKKISSKGKNTIVLTKKLNVPTGKTVKLYMYLNVKSPAKMGTFALGVTDFVGTIKSRFDVEFDNMFRNKSLYCNAYGSFQDPVYGTLSSVLPETKAETKKVHTLEFKSKNIETDAWVETGLNESYLSSAKVAYDSYNQPYIFLKFNKEGAKLFEKITEQNVGNIVGIFVKGELISSPRVYEKISGGEVQIAGQFTLEDAKKLAKQINDGIK